MTEDPQVVSISSSLPLSPDEIARKSFPPRVAAWTARRCASFSPRWPVELRELTRARGDAAPARRRSRAPRRRTRSSTRRHSPEQLASRLPRSSGPPTTPPRTSCTTAEQRAAELLAEAEHVLERPDRGGRHRGAGDPPRRRAGGRRAQEPRSGRGGVVDRRGPRRRGRAARCHQGGVPPHGGGGPRVAQPHARGPRYAPACASYPARGAPHREGLAAARRRRRRLHGR